MHTVMTKDTRVALISATVAEALDAEWEPEYTGRVISALLMVPLGADLDVEVPETDSDDELEGKSNIEIAAMVRAFHFG